MVLLPIISCFWQVIFEGVVGSSYTGDIAIDDFSLKAGSCFYGEYWIIALKSPILSTGRPPSVRVAVVVNEHRYFVYLINTDSIKLNVYIIIQALEGEKQKKNITTKWPS